MKKCFKIKKCFKQHFLTKTILAALAAAATLLAPAPARADTSWVNGGNWASFGTYLTNNGIMFPSGISNSTTIAQAQAVADQIAFDDKSVGINFVRTCINPATVHYKWPVVQAYVNELKSDGLVVDLCCWYDDGTGVMPDFNTWKAMWQTVDGVYHGDNYVYYEALNEPHGYTSESQLATDVYLPFLGFITKSKNHLILDGTGFADDVTGVGADTNLSACLLGVHDYAMWDTSRTTESAWESQLQGAVGIYWGRTIMTEFAAETTSGLDYGTTSTTNHNISFIRGMCAQCRAWPMGSVYFPDHQQFDYNTKRLFNGPDFGGGILSLPMVKELQNGWGFYTAAIDWSVCDFSVNGRTDYSVFRPAGSTWIIQSGGGGQFGLAGDIAVPADYFGNGKAQIAVWRQSDGEHWYISQGATTQFGLAGDIPVPGDYLGTGKAQLAVWRPAGGNWYVNGGSTTQWGLNGDIPVPGYYNGDGHLDLAVYRPSNNTWYINGGATVQFGTNGDIPVPGDYNGSGKTQIAMFRPSDSTWHINGGATVQWGLAGDIPVPGDYNGSGLTQIAVWRPSNGTWYVDGVSTIAWGTNGDIPLPLPYAIRHYCLGFSQ